MINVIIDTEIDNGWKCYRNDECILWFKGYLLGESVNTLINPGSILLKNDTDLNELIKWIGSLRGHFGIIYQSKKYTFASVDKLRSIPIFYKKYNNTYLVGNYAPLIMSKIATVDININQDAVTEISMSGYTIGDKTLYNGLRQLLAGECLFMRANHFSIERYYSYSPWNVQYSSVSFLKKQLNELLLNCLQDMVASADSRQIVIPLSAGYDSRLIASGLKELGVSDVLCFSYGSANSFEVKTAKNIADRLGYKWIFVPLSLAIQRKIFNEEIFSDYLEFSDTYANSPGLLDYSAMKILSVNNHISNDAIIVNGNSGDYISGAHVDSYMSNATSINTIDCMMSRFIDKHYSLWQSLKTEHNKTYIVQALQGLMNQEDGLRNVPIDLKWAVFEYLEWIGRQSKFVSTAQRSYEFFDYDWRLPLWDPMLMDFWSGVELFHKSNQGLYRETLIENDWGNVWSNVPVNNFRINSMLIKSIRNICKLFFVPAGKRTWHKFDNHFFSYFLDATYATAIVPYSKVFLDTRGARNRNSWISDDYLNNYR